MRLRLCLLCIISWTLLLPGCDTRHGGEPASAPRVELIYWPAPNPRELALADTVVSRWNRLHPDIYVLMRPIPVSQSTEEVLLAAIAGKTTPDVCSNIWPGALEEYTRAGGLVRLDAFADFDSVVAERVPPDLLAQFRSPDGHFHQIPWKTNPVMMFYNARLFREAGVESVPRTYGEFLEAGAKVSRDTSGEGQIDIWMGERDIRPIWWQRLFDFYPFYIAASGGLTLFEGERVAFDNEHAVAVLGFFQECYRRRLFPQTFFQGGDPFLLERKATHFAGPFEIAELRRSAPQMEFGIAPLPVPDGHEGPVYTYGDFKNIAIFSTTEHPEEAWEFLKFLLRAEHDLMLLQTCNQIPLRMEMTADSLFADYFNRNPMMARFAEQAPRTRGVDGITDLKEILDALSQAYEACAVYGEITPREAARLAASRARSILEWNR
ncbi:MAG: extracellular solute-binding protein [Bacteroidota bacterium]